MASLTENPAELPAELAQIQAEAAALEPPPAAAGQADAAPAVPVDYVAEARGVVDIAAELLATVGPRTEAALTEERRARIAGAAGPLMQKYGLSLGVVFERWGAEINFLFAAVVVGRPIAAAINADLSESRAEKGAEQRPADPQPARPAADPYTAAFAGAE